MTYCSNCWMIGHTKSECKLHVRCRKCLDNWELNHECHKPILCAQYDGQHLSLSNECPVVVKYRQTLKNEVNKAIVEGVIHQVDFNQRIKPMHLIQNNCLSSEQRNGPNSTWSQLLKPAHTSQYPTENKQLGELLYRTNDVLDATRRMEVKIDNQVVQCDTLMKKSALNNDSLIALATIIQQLINVTLEKKNKQQLQSLAQQLKQFKDSVQEKFNLISNVQLPTPTFPLLQPNDNKTQTKSTTPKKNGNDELMEQTYPLHNLDV